MHKMARLRSSLIALAALAAPLAGCDSMNGIPTTRGPGYAEVSTADPKAVEANIDSLDAVVANHPDDPEAYNTRGVALAKIGKYERATADFSQAIKLDPRHAAAYTNRALAERQMGANDAALTDFSHAIDSIPTMPPPISAAPTFCARKGISTTPCTTSTRPSASIPRTPRLFTRGG